MPRIRVCGRGRRVGAGHASRRSAVELRAHVFELAGEFGGCCSLTEDADARPRWRTLRLLRPVGGRLYGHRVVTWPVVDRLSYYVALHELGHAHTWSVRPHKLRDEARAWQWALDVALVEPDQRTELHILECWTSH